MERPVLSKKRNDGQRFIDISRESGIILPSLATVVLASPYKPISICEATKSIRHLVKDLPDKVAYCTSKCENPEDELTLDESAAIFLYTLQWPEGQISFYTILNRSLRDDNRLKLAPFHQYLKLFTSALHKLPRIQDRIWRGETGDWGDLYKQGSVHVWSGVSSCSDMVYVTGDFLDQTKKRTLFNIKSINGKLIKNHSDFPDENEVLLPPDTYVRVKSSLHVSPDMCIVDLEEIVPTPEVLAQLSKATSPSGVALNKPEDNNIVIFWINSEGQKTKENEKSREKLNKLYNNAFISCETSEEAISYVQHKLNENIILVASEQVGRQIAPEINYLPQLKFIVVYCINEEAKEQWSKHHKKVKNVIVLEQEMIRKIQELDNIIKQQQQMISLIQNIMREPLVELGKSLQGFESVIPDMDSYVFTAKMCSSYQEDDLPRDESAAIYIYTMEWEPTESCIHSLLNKDLRSESHDLPRRWFPYLRLLFHGLNKLPSYQGTVWRGISGGTSGDYSIGQQGIWWGFSSTSPVMNHSLDFASTHGSCTLFHITCHSGKSIENYSRFSDEKEVLLLPGFHFEVIDILHAQDGLHIISLTEIGSSSEEIILSKGIDCASEEISRSSDVRKVHALCCEYDLHKLQDDNEAREKPENLFGDDSRSFGNLEEPVNENSSTQFTNLSVLPTRSIDINTHPIWRLAFVTGVRNQPLLSIEETLQIFIPPVGVTKKTNRSGNSPTQITICLYSNEPTVIPNLCMHINEAKRRSENPANGLTSDESAAIYIYTMESNPTNECLWYELNRALRSRNRLRSWAPYLQLLFHGLNKLPSYQGTVWRGTSGGIRGDYSIGQQGIWWGFSPASPQMNEIYKLSDTKSQFSLILIECKSGKSMKNYSTMTENEILLLPGFRYEVINNFQASLTCHLIHVKEIDSRVDYFEHVIPGKICEPGTILQEEMDGNMVSAQQQTSQSTTSSQTMFEKIVSFFTG